MTPPKAIFFDPQRKRWKRLRRILDVAAVVSTLVLAAFAISVLRRQQLPELLLSTPKRNYKALKETEPAVKKLGSKPRRKTALKPTDIPLNAGESLRAAYLVEYDEASYSSLKENIHSIDLLYPEWLHVVTPDGKLTAYTLDNRPFDVVDRNGVHNVDRQNRVARTISESKANIDVLPLIQNADPNTGFSRGIISTMLADPVARQHFQEQVDAFLAGNPTYSGISLDFEDIPSTSQANYRALIGSLYADLHAKNLRLHVNTPVDDDDFDLAFLAANSDGVVLMNYDQHQAESGPGPIAGQDWFVKNLQVALKTVPRNKLICAIGGYGYDWTMPLPAKGKPESQKPISVDSMSTQEAWQAASDADASPDLDEDSLNVHFAYDDEDNKVRHQVWFLDAVTALNQMRAARQLGIQTFALWRLGSEDRSLWAVWDKPQNVGAPAALTNVPPGEDVDTEGEGDILRITARPVVGKRSITIEPDKRAQAKDPDFRIITDENIDVFPQSYTVTQYGYHPDKVALTFDDGPDARWTPKILDVLKRKNVKAAFMVIGEQAQDNAGILQRYVAEGHEVGNHTFTHPDISNISQGQIALELNLTERLFASKLGVQPLYFRPPYSIDQEPDTNDQAAPADYIQSLGYTIIGDKIDTSDWDEHPRKTPQQITDSVLGQLAAMKDKPQFRGSIILMHDGGGDRSATVAALPVLIDALRAKGYQIVPVSELMGKTRAEVMPPLTERQRWRARIDSIAFFAFAFFNRFVVAVFFVGDILMSAKLIVVGVFAVIDRLRKRKSHVPDEFEPQVAVVIPAYNEETVIVRTIRSVLQSSYAFLRVIVVDDGSTDRTFDVAREAYRAEIASGRLAVMTKPNAGKAEALNFALQYIEEDFYVGIDADTVIAPDAISKMVPHFADAEIGAVAGNAKVGNRVNLWTRWQALEYITSQNFERRALDLFGVVTVVPGAIGAWRTAPVKAAGGYPLNTVAEDADLTMSLLEQGYKVVYEDHALAFTEAPATARGLMRQRFRWSFGILQAVYKHKRAFLKNKAMGLFALPNIFIFQIVLPLLSPFIDLMFVAGTAHYLIDRYFHPEAASSANFDKLLVYFLTFLVIDFLASTVAFALEPKHPANKGDGWLLFHIWLQRFAYRQVFSVVLFRTIKRAIDGRPFAWDKIERTAKMSRSTERATVSS
jgi:cellulose synthase/poly-beta-1,6-N-acetylglucosamine synthase-like glycosyltransferase/peptidoglycan/xylan/chitin deacetylase (PgdA/CDA1 family)/spore germination protein YaaH